MFYRLKSIPVIVLLMMIACCLTTAQTPYKSLNYIYSISGSKTVAGQQGYGYWETMHSVTGKYPAMWGEDLSFVISFGGANMADDRMKMAAQALQRWNDGAIVNIMYHACPPTMSEPCSFDNVKSRITDAQWNELITNGTNLNNAWKARLDAIAPSLQYLRDNGVEVFFRPFHEMNHPSVFWWANRPGPNGSAKLYQITHDYLVNNKGLTNLIWIWNLQDFNTLANDVNNYDPGSNYYDMFTLDNYNSDGTGYSATKYNIMTGKAGSKPIGLGECDVLPSPSLLSSQPRWTYFLAWRELTQQKNSNATISTVYNASNVSTLDEMPGWRTCDAVAIPATLQGENYCSGSGVSTETTTDSGGGLNLSSIETNDWAAYRINVPIAGTYTVQYRVASLNGGGSLRLEKLGGGTTYGTVAIPQTSGWQNWTTVSGTVQLPAGVQDVAIVGAVGGFNVNWFTFSSQCSSAPSQPGAISGNASVASGSVQTYSVAGVSGATSYTWTLPSGWTGSSTTNSITATAGANGGTISVTANNACGTSAASTLTVGIAATQTNLALNKPVTASSTENTSYPASNANDGNTTTRWSSAYSDPQWIYVDLQNFYDVNRVKITWETALASAYQVQVSNDASAWTTIRSVTGNTTNVNDITGLTGTGRYVRIYGTTRATQWGYSIFELEVYGTASSCTSAPVQPGAITGNTNVTAGSSQIYSIAAVSGATSYTWSLPSGWSGSSTSTSVTATAGPAGGTISVVANNSCGSSVARTLDVNVASSNTNIAYNKPVSVTSVEAAGYEGFKAVDANGTTRWSSSYADNQNFVVDLGAVYNINRIRIAWEAAYAKNYQIQTSLDNSTWTTIKEFWGKPSSAADDYTGLNNNTRWLKVYCINRATAYGFSIFEFEAYGNYVGGRQSATPDEKHDDAAVVYPNPANEKITIQIPARFQHGNVALHTADGKILTSEKVKGAEHTFDLINLPSGMYIIHLYNQEDRRAFKFFRK